MDSLGSDRVFPIRLIDVTALGLTIVSDYLPFLNGWHLSLSAAKYIFNHHHDLLFSGQCRPQIKLLQLDEFLHFILQSRQDGSFPGFLVRMIVNVFGEESKTKSLVYDIGEISQRSIVDLLPSWGRSVTQIGRIRRPSLAPPYSIGVSKLRTLWMWAQRFLQVVVVFIINYYLMPIK